jgi:2-oxoglutarate ferredoxin oxidoreductase subunit alpha
VATETPIVIVNVMRVGPSTGIASKPWQGDIMQARFGSHSDYEIISLYPWSVQEAFDLTIEAFNLAEKYMTPIILLSDGILARMREKLYIRSPNEVEIIERRKPNVAPEVYKPYARDENLVPTIASFGDGYAIIRDSLTHDERGYYLEKPETQAHYVWVLNEKIKRNAEKIQKWDEKFTDDAEVVFIAAGPMARIVLAMVKEARSEGLKWGFFRPITIWPFPEKQLNNAVRNANNVIVVEMSYGKLIYPVRWTLRNNIRIGHIPWLSYVAPSPDEIRKLAEKEVMG